MTNSLPERRHIVAVEEHFLTRDFLAFSELPGETHAGEYLIAMKRRLLEVGEDRLAAMDDQGVDVQVLSLNSPGLQSVRPADSVHLAVHANDSLHSIIATYPARFDGFAALPTSAPHAAAAELYRSTTHLGFAGALINGRTFSMNCDDRAYDDIWGVAEQLRAPIFLHPQKPADPIQDLYYAGFTEAVDQIFATSAIGWHYETGTQLLRMIIGGVFDRFPNLQIIVGHWGELVLFFLERVIPQLDAVGLKLQRPISEVFAENVWVTGSGILSQRYLQWTVDLIGANRILSSTDYPWVDNSSGRTRAFLNDAALTDDQKNAIASENWMAVRAPRDA